MPILAICHGAKTATCETQECQTLQSIILASQKHWMTNRTNTPKILTFNHITKFTTIPFNTIKKRILKHGAEYFNLLSVPEDGTEELYPPLKNPFGNELDEGVIDELRRLGSSFYRHEVAAFHELLADSNLLTHRIESRRELMCYLQREFAALYEEKEWLRLCPERECLAGRRDRIENLMLFRAGSGVPGSLLVKLKVVLYGDKDYYGWHDGRKLPFWYFEASEVEMVYVRRDMDERVAREGAA